MEKLLNIRELSELVGFSSRTIYDWGHVRFVPHYKFPKGVRFKASEIDRWLKHKKIKGRITYNLDTIDI